MTVRSMRMRANCPGRLLCSTSLTRWSEEITFTKNGDKMTVCENVKWILSELSRERLFTLHLWQDVTFTRNRDKMTICENVKWILSKLSRERLFLYYILWQAEGWILNSPEINKIWQFVQLLSECPYKSTFILELQILFEF